MADALNFSLTSLPPSPTGCGAVPDDAPSVVASVDGSQPSLCGSALASSASGTTTGSRHSLRSFEALPCLQKPRNPLRRRAQTQHQQHQQEEEQPARPATVCGDTTAAAPAAAGTAGSMLLRRTRYVATEDPTLLSTEFILERLPKLQAAMRRLSPGAPVHAKLAEQAERLTAELRRRDVPVPAPAVSGARRAVAAAIASRSRSE